MAPGEKPGRGECLHISCDEGQEGKTTVVVLKAVSRTAHIGGDC